MWPDISLLLLKITYIILNSVEDVKLDVIHIQFEPGLYGLKLDPLNPSNSKTYLDDLSGLWSSLYRNQFKTYSNYSVTRKSLAKIIQIII